MDTTAARATIEKPEEETLEKIDFVIQGLENGQFEDLAKKVDFHQKLKGENAKRFVTSLIEVIEEQERELNYLRTDHAALQNKVIDLESMLHDYIRNMRGIANGLVLLADPDPFGQDYSRANNRMDTESFINDYKSKY